MTPTVGAMIRHIVLDPATGEMSPRAEALLYAADKAQHIFSVVGPALRRGAVVVCDRYVDSMLAYQGGWPGAATRRRRADRALGHRGSASRSHRGARRRAQ